MITEYVLQLRKHIQGGSRNHPTKSSHSYVDSATFWKDACNEAIAAQAELKARIDELERVNDILSSKLKPADKPGFELANGKRRKKRADSRTAVVRRSEGQKQVRSQSSESSIELDVAELEAYSDAAESKRLGPSNSPRPNQVLSRQVIYGTVVWVSSTSTG